MNYAYRLATLRIESDLELPDLMPWDGSAAAEPDIAFRLGKVPAQLESPDRVEAIFQTRGRDEYLLNLPQTGRILIRNGREVTIETESGADPLNTQALLTGPIQAVLWHQRGLLPLHANAIVVGERAVALCGPSAAGKSALTAVLARGGHKPLADDICVVDTGAAAPRAMVLPGVAVLRLWRDTIEQLGLAADGSRPALSGREKFFVNDWNGAREPRELAAVVVLVRRTNIALAIERLHGAVAVGALRDIVHMRRPARALGRDVDIFAALTRMVQAGVTVWRLRLPDDPGCLGDAAAKVLSVLEQN
jgi:hypothetical protein